MPKALFLRLLATPIPEKGDRLRALIADWNATAHPAAETFPADPAAFAAIPGSPFAYWVTDKARELFLTQPRFEQDGRVARVGDHPGDQERYLRLFWEIPVKSRSENRRWVPYQKGGAFSPYYSDIHLVADWDFERETYFDFHGRIGRSSEHPSNYQFFFRPGLTWPRRTNGFSMRALPDGCVFADKGPAIFIENNSFDDLMAINAILNSLPFLTLLKIQLARTELAQSFEVGIIQQTPIPSTWQNFVDELAHLALQAYELVRQPSLVNEATHVFCLPAILNAPGNTLSERLAALEEAENQRQASLAQLQAQIDARVTELYGVPELAESGEQGIENSEPVKSTESTDGDDDSDDEAASPLTTPYSLISDFLMWCVGVAFGRWDVRYALNPASLPPLPEPFAPLPIHSPGMLHSDSKNLTPDTSHLTLPHLTLTNPGFLVDDPDRPQDDIVANVQSVLRLLWGKNAEAIESEACQILGVPDLRAWFRDPKGFFAWHIKRYSKSRRKAPIYWLIQSARRNYAIWLYYPRLNHDSLYFAAREYADAKRNREAARLEDLQASLEALSGAARKAHEKKLAVQSALQAELKTYLEQLDTAALLDIHPDLNDGVLLNIAPLHEIVPWREPARAWAELLSGKYPWSHIAARLRAKKLVREI
jgi:hypothetical protein